MENDELEYSVKRINKLSDPLLESFISCRIEANKQSKEVRSRLGGHEELRDLYHRTSSRAAVIASSCWAAVKDGEVIGTVAWYPPGKSLMGDPKEADELQPAEARIASTYFKEYATRGDPEGKHVLTNSWTLYGLTVRPKYQREGVGWKLMSIGMEAKRDGAKVIIPKTDDK
ncbi:hypothetical protein BT69DRAFT_280791 [Atractiella rhizophila]|nr:hypothetical protein BT69DRAFT_280791 [Atractiella rhizophila]